MPEGKVPCVCGQAAPEATKKTTPAAHRPGLSFLPGQVQAAGSLAQTTAVYTIRSSREGAFLARRANHVNRIANVELR